jgi:hypothetical protein
MSQVGVSWGMKNYFRGFTKDKRLENTAIDDFPPVPNAI